MRTTDLHSRIVHAVARAELSDEPISVLVVVGHDDIEGATAATVAALRHADLTPSLVKVVERPGRLLDHPLMPDAPTVAVVIADARRGRRHQIEQALRTIVSTRVASSAKRIIALTVHDDAETMAEVVRDAIGVRVQTVDPLQDRDRP